MIASEGEERFSAALQVIVVPDDPPEPGLRAVDHGRPPLRLRGGAGHRRPGPAAPRGPGRHRGGRLGRPPPAPATTCSADLAPALEPPAAALLRRAAQRRLRRPPRGQHRGAPGRRCSATPSACCRSRPTRSSTARSARPSVVIEDLTTSLTRAIEELTRPVDAIKHQAKTVTVGISRSDESLLQVPLVRRGAGHRRRPRPAQLRLAAHAGHPRPGRRRGARLHPLPHRGPRRRRATTRPAWSWSTGAASAASSPSRTETQPRAARHQAPGGHRAAGHRRPGAAATGAPCSSSPRSRTTQATGLTLLHVRFPDHLPVGAMRSVLQGYRGRFSAPQGRGHRDRADLPRRPARHASRWSTC